MGILRSTVVRVVAACAVTAASIITVLTVAATAASADPFTYAQVSTGYHAACAVTTDGTGLCWGWNYQGSLGTRDTADRVVAPSRVVLPAGRRFSSIAAGEYFTTCGVDTDAAAWCWGQHHLGNYLITSSTSPVRVELPAGVRVAQLSNGGDMACAIDTTGLLWCWGDVASFGNGSTEATRTPERVPMPDGANVTSIDIGPGGTTCAVTSAQHLYCWGNNDDGEAGIGYVTQRALALPTAVRLPAGQVPSVVSGGLNRMCVLTTTGTGWCWGDNYEGSFGDGTYNDSSVPQQVTVPNGESLVSLHTAWYHTCATGSSGTTWCWGRGGFGELGTGTTLGGKTFRQPVLPTGTTFSSLSVGLATSCGIDNSSHIWCWTGSDWGVAGTGNTLKSLYPRQIAPIGSPSVAAPVASTVRAETATVAVSVTPNGAATSSVVQYATDSSFTSMVTVPARTTLAASYSASSVSVDLAGLDPRTTYWARVVSTNEYGSTTGAEVTFTTLGSEPTVSTPVVSSIGGTHATVSVTVDPGMLRTVSRMEWSTRPDFGDATTVPLDTTTGDVPVGLSARLEGLAPRSSVWVRVVSSNRLGTTVSPTESFTTLGRPPVVSSTLATSTVSSVTVTARVDGGDLSGTAVAEISRDGTFGDAVESPVTAYDEGENPSVTFTFTRLSSMTGYHVRVIARNALGSDAGEPVAIRTRGGVPVVKTPTISGIDVDTALAHVSVDSTGLATTVVVQVSTDSAFTADLEEHFVGILTTEGTALRHVALSSLDRRTTYWVRIVARNAAGTSTSDAASFTTLMPVGVVINDDDDSTSGTEVTLLLTAPSGSVAVRVSDNPTMRGARVHFDTESVAWSLPPSTEASATRTVYVQFVDAHGTVSKVYSDSIILETQVDDSGDEDVIAPEVSAARVTRVTAASAASRGPRLSVSGRDAFSGIASVQIRTTRGITKFPVAPTRSLTTSYVVPARGALWVRLVDAAGNYSRWRKVRGA